MNVLTCIVVGEEEEAEAIGASSNPVEEWTGVEVPGIDTAKIVTLHCLITGESFGEAMSAYEPVYTAPDEDTIVLRIPSHVVEKLAALDVEALDRVTAELTATEEFELAEWDSDDAQDLVSEFAELAQRAESDVLAMIVWMRALPGST